MGRRTVLLVTALVVAAIGTVLVFAYVRGVDDRALKDQAPVEVLVAKSQIAAGTRAGDAERAGAFKVERIAGNAVAPGALSAIAPITDLVAASDIFPGEQILRAKFTTAGTVDTLAIPAGKLAVSVQLGDPQRVAGFVKPGSEVAIFVSVKPIAVGPNGQTASNNHNEYTRLLLGRITVLAVGPTTLRPATNGTGNTETVPTAILTLALDQVQAQKVILGETSGALYFALLNKGSKVTPGAPAVDVNNMFR
jgi:pilus assembly protein CpaB